MALSRTVALGGNTQPLSSGRCHCILPSRQKGLRPSPQTPWYPPSPRSTQECAREKRTNCGVALRLSIGSELLGTLPLLPGRSWATSAGYLEEGYVSLTQPHPQITPPPRLPLPLCRFLYQGESSVGPGGRGAFVREAAEHFPDAE